MTPTVRLALRGVDWRYAAYARRAGVDVTRRNWTVFADRWAPILDAFRAVYRAPGSVWPMPPPDATQPLGK